MSTVLVQCMDMHAFKFFKPVLHSIRTHMKQPELS